MSDGERLQKLIARAGLASRRSAEAFITEGRVTVNGKVERELGARASLENDDVRVDGERLTKPKTRVAIMHKPTGVVTTLRDPEGRPTVAQFFPKEVGRLMPIGRLDLNSSGLLLLTNDGELAEKIAHPRNSMARVYLAKVRGRPDRRAINRLRKGVRLEDGPTGPAEVTVVEELPTKTWLQITIHEGRNREIRRMCELVGHAVEKLRRLQIGPLVLGDLPYGAWRWLDETEIRALRRPAPKPNPRSARSPKTAKSPTKRTRRVDKKKLADT